MAPRETVTEEGRSSQLLRGVLDMCLLALIADEPCYGYEMVRKLEARGLSLVGEGSIYPLLGRLQTAGLIESYLEPSNGGPPRKYYRARSAGLAILKGWEAEWNTFAAGVASVLEGSAR